MHTLVVLAHAGTDSYSHAVTQAVTAGLKDGSNDTYELADLVAEQFDPVFGATDDAVFRNGGKPPADILAEQARIDRADALVVIFPVFWWSMPAVLKGWIDRVFIQNWAFNDDGAGQTTGLLGRLSVQIIAVGGATSGTYERRGYRDAMGVQIDQGIFGYVGARMIGSELLLPLDAASSQAGLQRARDIGRNIKSAVLRNIPAT